MSVVSAGLVYQFWWWEDTHNMFTALQNKQKLSYSLNKGMVTKYQTDSEGNIVYKTINGKKVPIEIGKGVNYSDPISFFGNISFASGETEATEFGIDIGGYDCKLLMLRDELPIDETSLIFQDSKPIYEGGFLKDTSADFRVVKVSKSLNFTTYLLKRITK